MVLGGLCAPIVEFAASESIVLNNTMSWADQSVHPLTSLSEVIASSPESATVVGMPLLDDGTIAVWAPYGLDDHFPWWYGATRRP
jgi:hypothetical protein